MKEDCRGAAETLVEKQALRIREAGWMNKVK
jgi:hypothetical protein